MSGQSARDEILARIARALETPATENAADEPAPRAYRTGPDAADRERPLERFAARVADYRATVHRARGERAIAAVVAASVVQGAGPYAVPPDLPRAWLTALTPDLVVIDDGLGAHALDRLGGAISGCALAVAETGTIVLDGGPGQGRRATSLVPDRLIVVVRSRQIVGTLPEAMRALGSAMRDGPRALTLISGPSATSDIELSRVEGVHGPRRLDVVLVAGP